MPYMAMLAAALPLLLAAAVVRGFYTRHKVLLRLKREFGKAPEAPYKRASIPQYSEYLQQCAPCPAYVDDTTWGDLGMEEVYDRINACQTSVGEDHLYALLRRPRQRQAPLRGWESLLCALGDEKARLKVQGVLARLGKRIGAQLPQLLFCPASFQLKNAAGLWAAAMAPLLALPLFLAHRQAGALWLAACALNNLRLYAEAIKKLQNCLETMSYFMAVLAAARRLQKQIAPACPAYAARLGRATEPFRGFECSAVLLAPSPQSDADTVMKLFSMATLLPLLQYCAAVRRLCGLGRQMREVCALVGGLDAAVSVLSFRRSLAFYTVPVFCGELSVCAVQVIHPLVKEGVPNDACIQTDWLLTGSNAAGKSTFLKTIGINNILAQTIHTCTARSYRMKLAPVVTSMAVRDDVACGQSYFVAELGSLKRIVDACAAGRLFYCLIDEVLKGTNTRERVAASAAVLQYLGAGPCLCLAATHDIELTSLLSGQYENYHFSGQATAAGLKFDYKLKNGPAAQGNALGLLGLYGFPREIVKTARALARRAL